MKLRILIIAGLIQGIALSGHCSDLSDCESRLQAIADHFRNPASRLAGYRLDVKVMVSSRVPDDFDAYADSRGNKVYVAPRVCRYGDMSKIMLLAHEIGHLVGHARLPELKGDAYSVSPRIGLAVHEGVADEMAATMMRQIPTLDFAIDALRSLCAAESSRSDGSDFAMRYGSSACTHLGGFTSGRDGITAAR